MIILSIIFSFLMAFALAVLFEAIHGTLAQHYTLPLPKAHLSRLFFCVVGVLWCLNANVAWIVQLPALLGVALSHSDLCRHSSRPITWRQILSNIVPATTAAVRRVFP